MTAKRSAWLLPLLLLGGVIVISGCTQAPSGGTPTSVIPPDASKQLGTGGGAAATTAAAGAGGAAATPAVTVPAVTVTVKSGSAADFSAAFIACTPGTPWEFGASTAGASSGYTITYTVAGKTQFKVKEFCKVEGRGQFSIPGQAPIAVKADIYYAGFKWGGPGTQASYDELWTVSTDPSGKVTEKQEWAGGKKV